ncbi:MAG: carboxypeptidase regulatory-like domain-containing protein, partial [Flavobacteriales bacterium]
MLLRILPLLLGLGLPCFAAAQGTIRGKVTDSKGETLIGAAVVLKSDPGRGTTTDLEGRYSLVLDAPGPHVLVARYVGYE